MRDHNTIYGIITYIVHNNIEIISLNSLQEKSWYKYKITK